MVKILVKFFACVALLAAIIFFAGRPIPPALPFAAGKMLSPFTGFWQNASTSKFDLPTEFKIVGLKDDVSIAYDKNEVPHIIAKNEHDLFVAQGYVVASNRLWQMDFISRAAAGRMSEILGPIALNFDKGQRRQGLLYAAEQAMEQIKADEVAMQTLSAYAQGVNAYINSLSAEDYPIEYKILNYEPEPWTELKTALLLRYMGNMLASSYDDVNNTRFMEIFDSTLFNFFYNTFPINQAPIIPPGTEFNFETAIGQRHALPAKLPYLENEQYSQKPSERSILGSNNWAIGPNKSKSGNAILCSDPHLALNLPAIWFEMQLTAPGYNSYGVTLPGSPAIIIGFNDSIAWGVTNAERDVTDIYNIKFKDNTLSEYEIDSTWQPVIKRVEEFAIKDSTTVTDTLFFTKFGLTTRANKGIARQWTVLDPSNELMAFYGLNKANNLAEFNEAINNMHSPGQNFVFASTSGDIAIKQQGKFPINTDDRSRFVQEGTSSDDVWSGFIPMEHNPYAENPERGYLFSANQNPTDETYPYKYWGPWETFRNRRIDDLLSADTQFSIEDMQQMQVDNYSVQAAFALPVLMPYLDSFKRNEAEQNAFDLINDWNYNFDKDLQAPTIFSHWLDELDVLLWDEFYMNKVNPPSVNRSIEIIMSEPKHVFYDVVETEEIEDLKTIIAQSFKKTVLTLEENGGIKKWGKEKNTTLSHITNRLPAFDFANINSSGCRKCINATGRSWGPSWRMVVEMGDEITAYSIYGGGQSGNPGSSLYNNRVEKWANGQYNKVEFLRQNTKVTQPIFTQKLVTK